MRLHEFFDAIMSPEWAADPVLPLDLLKVVRPQKIMIFSKNRAMDSAISSLGRVVPRGTLDP